MNDTADKMWHNTLWRIREYGLVSSPRGINTWEILSNLTSFDMHYPVVVNPDRKLSYKFMAAEASWVLAGSNRLDFHHEIKEKLEKYSDDGVVLNGAYGPHVLRQIEYAIACLKNDISSRQAVIGIWQTNPKASKDIPCTLSLQFLIRNSILYTMVSMRSSDAWMGLPYDMFTFSCISRTVASALRVELGTCYITAGSSHIYLEDFKKYHVLDKTPDDYAHCVRLPIGIDLKSILVEASNAKTNAEAKSILMSWRLK